MTFVIWACGGSDLGGLATPRLGSSSLGPGSSAEYWAATGEVCAGSPGWVRQAWSPFAGCKLGISSCLRSWARVRVDGWTGRS